MPIKTPIGTDLIARVSSMTSQRPGWFSPLKPIAPVVPKEQQAYVEGRMFDYPTGYNVSIKPRSGENVSFADMIALADSYDLLRLVIETRKDQLGGLKWAFAPRDGIKSDMASQVKELTDFFMYPDKEHDWDTWLRSLVEDLLVIDAPCLYPRKTKGGGLYALEPVDGATIKRVIDDFGRTPYPPDAAYQQIIKGVPVMNYMRDELIYRPRNVRTRRVYGYSPVEQVILTVNIALRRQTHQLQYYTEGNVPEALIGVPESWTPEQIKQFQIFWDQLIEGDTAQRRHAKFVPGDMKYQPTKDAVLKDQYDEWLARVVCFAFSLSPQAFVLQMNRATAETAQETAQAEGLAPLMLWIKSTIDHIVVKYFGYGDLEFKWVNQEELDPEARARVHQIYVELKAITPDEVREDLGKKPLSDAEKAAAFPAQPEPTPQVPGEPMPTEPTPASAKAKEALAKAGKKPVLAPIVRDRAVVAELTDQLAGIINDTLAGIADGALKAIGITEKAGPDNPLLALLQQINVDGWIAAVGKLADVLAKVAADGGLEAAIQLGIEDVADDMLSQVNLESVKWAKAHSAELVGMKYVKGKLIPNPNAVWRIDEMTRDGLNKLVVSAEQEGWSNQRLAASIRDSYAFSPERAMTIARTETANADIQGNMIAYEKSGMVEGKRWLVAQSDYCPICERNGEDGEIGFDEPFNSGVFHPPAHPNCRCDVIPVLVAEESEKLEKKNDCHDHRDGRFCSGSGGGVGGSHHTQHGDASAPGGGGGGGEAAEPDHLDTQEDAEWDAHRALTDQQIDRFNEVATWMEADESYNNHCHDNFTASQMKSVHKLTQNEIYSVQEYTGSEYRRINAVLRDKVAKYYPGESDKAAAYESYAAHGPNIRNAIGKSSGLDHDYIVHRGMVMDKKFVDRLAKHQDEPGMIAFTDHGIISASSREGFANNWKNDNSHPGKEIVRFDILIPKETGVGRALPVKHISNHGHEDEVLLKPKSTFKLLNVYKEGKRTMIQAVMVDPGAEHWKLDVIKLEGADMLKSAQEGLGKFIVDAEDLDWFDVV